MVKRAKKENKMVSDREKGAEECNSLFESRGDDINALQGPFHLKCSRSTLLFRVLCELPFMCVRLYEEYV